MNEEALVVKRVSFATECTPPVWTDHLLLPLGTRQVYGLELGVFGTSICVTPLPSLASKTAPVSDEKVYRTVRRASSRMSAQGLTGLSPIRRGIPGKVFEGVHGGRRPRWIPKASRRRSSRARLPVESLVGVSKSLGSIGSR